MKFIKKSMPYCTSAVLFAILFQIGLIKTVRVSNLQTPDTTPSDGLLLQCTTLNELKDAYDNWNSP